jgi:hypothetical protein
MNSEFEILNFESRAAGAEWLPDMDLNHDKQIQSLLCYRYTIGQFDPNRLLTFAAPSSHENHFTTAKCA